MKKITVLLALALMFSCKNDKKNIEVKENQAELIYPENVSKVFEAHGGIKTWKDFEGLYYEIEKSEGNDVYNISLKDRKSLISMKHHQLGYDGEYIWLKNLDTTKYKGNAKFYYNLMFYFYAMPFVLGDDGINYQDIEPLQYEGASYPGVLISYNSGVGESPDDEYILYYHPDTHEMSWLAYTVTYFSKEKSKKFNLIRYNNWENVEGVKLPSKLQWHNYNEGKIGDIRNEISFVNSKLSKEKVSEDMFKVPDTTMIVK
jgi:hypothetical protein